MSEALKKYQIGGGGTRAKQGSFALNPSVNPTFAIVGGNPVPRDQIVSNQANLPPLYVGTPLTVKLSCNLDGTPLKAADKYRFFLMEWDDFVAYTGTSAYPTDKINGADVFTDPEEKTVNTAKYPTLKLIQLTLPPERQGSNYLFTVPIPSSGVVPGKQYVLLVRGKDQMDNDAHTLIPDLKGVKNGVYGFTLRALGNAPEVTVSQINGKPVTEQAFVKKGSDITFKATVDKDAKLRYRLDRGNATVIPQAEVDVTAGAAKTITIPSSGLDNKDDTYRLLVQADANGNPSFEQTFYIVYDVQGPEVRILSPAGDLSGAEGNSLKIKGTAFDTGSGLADTSPVAVTLVALDGGPAPALGTVTGKENWELPPIALPDGKYKLAVTAKDKVGFDATATRDFTYDKAAPKITGLTMSTDAGNTAAVIDGNGEVIDPLTRINKTGTVTIAGVIDESYGLKSFTITSKSTTKTGGSPSATTMPLIVGNFSKALSLDDDTYDIEIVLIDKANKKTSQTISVVVDTKAPVFQNMTIAGNAATQGASITTNSSTVALKGKIEETGSGVKKLEYQVQGDTSWTELSAAKKTDGYYFEGAADVSAGAAKTITLRVTDNADRTASWNCTVQVFTTTATITLKVEDTPNPFVNKDGIYYRKKPATLKIVGHTTAPTAVHLTVTVKKNGGTATLSDFFSSSDVTTLNALTMDGTTRSFSTKADIEDGEYAVTASGGGAPEKTVTVVIDNQGPDITPVAPQDGGIITTGYKLQAALSDTSGIQEAKAYYKKDGGAENPLALSTTSPYTATLPPSLTEGKYEVWFTAKDRLGNEKTSEKMVVWYDTASPVLADVTINGKEDPQVYSKKGETVVTVAGKATDANGIAKVEILVNGAVKHTITALGAAGAWTQTLTVGTDLPEGMSTITVRATDKAGKISLDVQRTVTVDTADPTLSLNTISEGTVVNNTRWMQANYIQLSGTVTDTAPSSGIDRVEYSVDGGANWRPVAVTGTTWSAGVSLGATGQGVQLRAVDKAGNTSTPITEDIKYDTTQPTITITKPNSNVYTSGSADVEVAYTAVDPTGGSGLKDNSVEIVIVNSSGVPDKTYQNKANDTFTIPKADIATLAEGEKTVKISVLDNAGNRSSQAQFSMIVDKTAPTVGMLNPTPDATGWAKTLLVGKITVNGSFADGTGGSGINGDAARTCTIGKDKSPLLAGDTFSATTALWTLEIADIGKYGTADYSAEKYTGAVVPSADGKIYKVPLYITVKDRAGNSKEQEFFIMADSDGKTPKVTIQAPQQESTTDPDSADAHNKLKKITLGGTALFSGIAQTSNPASGAKIVEIQARFSPKSDFSESFTKAKILGTGTVDWKNGDAVLKSTTDSLYSWSFLVDCSAFLQGNTTGVQDLYYSIRAKNDAGDFCDWTPARLIKLDKNAPSFENSQVGVDAVAGVGGYEKYVDNIFVKEGDYLVSNFVSTSGISKIEITSDQAGTEYLNVLNKLENNAAILNAKIDNKAVFTAYSNSTGGVTKSGYTMKLPIKTASLADPNLNFKIKVTLTGGQSGGLTTNLNYFALKYDTKKPAAIFGVSKGNFKQLTCTTTEARGIDVDVPTSKTLATVVGELKANIKNLYLFAETTDDSAIEIALTDIVESDGKAKVTFKDAVANIKTDGIGVLIEKDPVVFDPKPSSYQVEGFAYDFGSGVKTVTASIGTQKVEISKFTSQLGQFVSFKDSLSTDPLADGGNTLKLAVLDKAKNAGAPKDTTVYVRNKPLKLEKIHFNTDLNGNDAYDAGSPTVVESVVESGSDANVNALKNYEQTVNVAQQFTLKNKDKSQIKFELNGGEGTARNFTLYLYKVRSVTTSSGALEEKLEKKKVKEGALTGNAIDFAATDFGTGDAEIPDRDNQHFVIVVTDGATGDPARQLTLQVTFNVKVEDDRTPSVFVAPFYWNSDTDNSLAGNSAKNGHIEIKTVLDVDEGVPDVSGTVVIRGTAYHPAKLTKLELTVPGVTGALTSEYKKVGGTVTWTTDAGLKVTDRRLDLNGHWVSWEYQWTTGTVGKNQTITLKAYHDTTFSDSTATSTAVDSVALHTAAANRTTTTSLELAAGDTAVPGQLLRIVDAAAGDKSYLVTILSVTGSVVTWKKEGAVSTSVDVPVVDVPVDLKSYYLYHGLRRLHTATERKTMTSLELAAGDTAVPGQFLRIVDAAADKSYLVTIASVTNSVVEWKAVDASTSADVPVDLKGYYLYPVGYTENAPAFNKPALTVNVVPYITGIKTALSSLGGNEEDLYARTALGHYPVKDKEAITVSGFNLAGATCTVGGVSSGTLSGASSPWTLTLDPAAKSGELKATVSSVAAINNTNNNYRPYNKGAKTANNDKLNDDVELDVWEFESDAVKPSNGTITDAVMKINPSTGFVGFAFANGADRFSMPSATQSYAYRQRNWDDYGSVGLAYGSNGTAHAVAAARDTNFKNYEGGFGDAAGPFTYFSSADAVTTNEVNSAGGGYAGTGGFKLESLGTPATNAVINKKRIQSPSLAISTAGVYLAYYDAITDQIRFRYRAQVRTNSVANRPIETPIGDYSLIAGGSTGNTPGKFVSIAVKPGTNEADDVVVAVWYTGNDLVYAYKTNPANDNDASSTAAATPAAGHWSKPVTIFQNAGEYCQVAVDKAGGVHIAAFDGAKADLLYAFMSSYNKAAEVKKCTVDSYGITGTNITLDVAYSAANGKPVPYIGYYADSAMRPKLAYLVLPDPLPTDPAKFKQLNPAPAGADDNGKMSGEWEIAFVPTTGRPEKDRVNVGVWKDANGIIKDSTSGTTSSNTSNGLVYGNGTNNPILGYIIRTGTIETAQKK